MIHPTAVIHPDAEIDSSVEIGPYAIVDGNVVIGPDCRVGPQVHLTGHTTIGHGNTFHTGCVIGDAPQDLKYADEPTRLIIGDQNTFREHFTVHRSNRLEEHTSIGSNGFYMAHSHVGHNSVIHDHVILANGALVAGHVVIDDHVFLSGNCLVHQFVRIGRLALMQGGAAISQDLPPFCIASGDNGICGLNTIGLRRNGYGPSERAELKRLYHHLFRGDDKMTAAAAAAREQYTTSAAVQMLDFVSQSRRGVCRHLQRRHN